MVNEAFPRFVKYGFKILHALCNQPAPTAAAALEKIFGKSARAICADALNPGFIRACYDIHQLRDKTRKRGCVERDGWVRCSF
jgi:hypothetical protein